MTDRQPRYTIQQTSKTIKAGSAIGGIIGFAGLGLLTWASIKGLTGSLIGLMAIFLLLFGLTIAGYARVLKWWHHD